MRKYIIFSEIILYYGENDVYLHTNICLMQFYTVETSPEVQNGEKYVSVRCPHIGINGYVCDRQLLRLVCDGNASIEIKCPKCKSLIRVKVLR